MKNKPVVVYIRWEHLSYRFPFWSKGTASGRWKDTEKQQIVALIENDVTGAASSHRLSCDQKSDNKMKIVSRNTRASWVMKLKMKP